MEQNEEFHEYYIYLNFHGKPTIRPILDQDIVSFIKTICIVDRLLYFFLHHVHFLKDKRISRDFTLFYKYYEIFQWDKVIDELIKSLTISRDHGSASMQNHEFQRSQKHESL